MRSYASLLLLILTLNACAGSSGPPPAFTKDETRLIRLGRTVEKSGDIKSAIGFYKQAIDASAGRTDAHLALSRLYMEQGDIEHAKETLKSAKAKRRNDPEVNLRLGKIAISESRAGEALRFFDDGLKEAPDSVDLLSGRGIALDMLERHAEAQTSYRMALNQPTKGNEFVYNNLALSYLASGDYDQAITLLKGIPDIKKYPVMRQNLALAYGLKGDMANARSWGRKDLSEKEMQDNIAYYKAYRERMQ